MFCNYCGKQNKDDAVFCKFCGKALPQKSPTVSTVQPAPVQTASSAGSPTPQKMKPARKGLSFNAVKGIITAVIIIVLVLVVLQLYYPNLLPWN